jgi:uncharacterized protein YgbK (DUF1537 family)
MNSIKIYKSILIIADDFTGANDTAAQFSKLGYRTISILKLDLLNEYLNKYDVVAIDTESRSDNASEAYRKLYEIGLSFKDFNNVLFYKKVDSTLRGNITEEIKGLFDAMHPDLIVFAPAFPKQGRTTLKGIHYVKGVPVDQTYFGKDLRTPVKSSYLPSYFNHVFRDSYKHVLIDELRSEDFVKWINKYKVFSFDVENENDLKVIVESLIDTNKKILWVGSAGLSEILAYNAIVGNTIGKPVLLVIGSLNDVTRKQLLNFISNFNNELIKINIESLFINFNNEFENIKKRVIEGLTRGTDVIITTSYDTDQVNQGIILASKIGISTSEFGAKLAEMIGKITFNIINNIGTKSFSGIFATGGDIAMALVKNMNIDALDVIGEIEPGVPLLRYKDFFFVTKAGGFGKDSTIVRIVARIKGASL